MSSASAALLVNYIPMLQQFIFCSNSLRKGCASKVSPVRNSLALACRCAVQLQVQNQWSCSVVVEDTTGDCFLGLGHGSAFLLQAGCMPLQIWVSMIARISN